jgi:hypothetical protein
MFYLVLACRRIRLLRAKNYAYPLAYVLFRSALFYPYCCHSETLARLRFNPFEPEISPLETHKMKFQRLLPTPFQTVS